MPIVFYVYITIKFSYYATVVYPNYTFWFFGDLIFGDIALGVWGIALSIKPGFRRTKIIYIALCLFGDIGFEVTYFYMRNLSLFLLERDSIYEQILAVILNFSYYHWFLLILWTLIAVYIFLCSVGIVRESNTMSVSFKK